MPVFNGSQQRTLRNVPVRDVSLEFVPVRDATKLCLSTMRFDAPLKIVPVRDAVVPVHDATKLCLSTMRGPRRVVLVPPRGTNPCIDV